jgi:hypothetical protein
MRVLNVHAQGANASKDEDRRRSENMLEELRVQVAQLRSNAHKPASSYDHGQVDNNPAEARGAAAML